VKLNGLGLGLTGLYYVTAHWPLVSHDSLSCCNSAHIIRLCTLYMSRACITALIFNVLPARFTRQRQLPLRQLSYLSLE